MMMNKTQKPMPEFLLTECKILSVTACEEGEAAAVVLENSYGVKKRVTVSAQTVYTLKLGSKQALSEAEVQELMEAALLYRAVKKAADILSYGENTKYEIVRKLTARGYPRRCAEEAAAYLEQTHFIQEKAFAESYARALFSKLYGRKKIQEQLYKRGFEKKYILHALQVLDSECDYCENLKQFVIKKRLSEALFPDVSLLDQGCGLSGEEIRLQKIQKRKERDHAIAAILRNGYSFDEIHSLSRKDFG